SDCKILSLNPGDFLFELRSTEPIDKSKHSGQSEGDNRPGFGSSHLGSDFGWEEELELQRGTYKICQDAQQANPESRRHHRRDQTAKFTCLKRHPIFFR